jgi:hypothetical protein
MATAYLLVRAVVAEAADRPRFDRWYAMEHLPQAAEAFGARRAWRCWSKVDPSVHLAFYEFNDAKRAEAVVASPEMQAQVAEFDRVWDTRVTRTRDILEVAGGTGPAGG